MDQERPPDTSADPPQPASPSTGAWEQPTASPPAPPPPTSSWQQPTSPPPPGQPPVTWAPEPPPVAGPFVRSGAVTTAAVILIVLGVLGLLLGALLLASREAVISQLGDQGVQIDPEAASGVISIIAVVLIVFSIGYVVAGWAGYRGSDLGRVLGLVLGVIGVLFWLLGLASSLNPTQGGASSLVFALVFLVAHAFVLFAYGARWRRA
jgi:hypothetical protein